MTLRASISTTLTFCALSGRNLAIVCGSCCANGGSISTATTWRAASANPRVREPSPGPISSTVSSSVISAAATMRRIVFGSITKFCPRVFVGRMPSCAARSRISWGPSRGLSLRFSLTLSILRKVADLGRRTPLTGADSYLRTLRFFRICQRVDLTMFCAFFKRALGAA